MDTTSNTLPPITKRVTTFGEALDVLGEDHPFVQQWLASSDLYSGSTLGRFDYDLSAYLMLRIITAALNEGWEPKFCEGEYRYYPWFTPLTQKDISEYSEEAQQRLTPLEDFADCGDYVAMSDAISIVSAPYSLGHVGARLCFKSAELAQYAGTQFSALYADFSLLRK